MSPPMKLAPPSRSLQEQELRRAREILAPRQQSAETQGPWEGIVPGLPHEIVGLAGALLTRGIVARADNAGGGELLTNDGGYVKVDPATSNIGISTHREVALLRDFPLRIANTRVQSGDFRDSPMALVAMTSGATPVAGSFSVWRIPFSTGVWTEIPFNSSLSGSAIAANECRGTIDGDVLSGSVPLVAQSILSMPEAIVFERGAPGTHRQGLSTDQGGNGTINQPAFIFTNNIDPVSVWPRANNVLEYEPLTDQFGSVADPCDFRCVSLENFNDRVYFLNTREHDGTQFVRHPTRLRRTARGTCDPDPALVGSGYISMDEFSGQGVKCKKLGNVLACYFQDGVSFVRATGSVTTPDGVQVLNEHRGLLSTGGLVSIGDNEHFGIFDDGWWRLDSSGRWREAGIASFNGKQLRKWKEFFYGLLSREAVHRLQLHYDEFHNWIRMCIPTGTASDLVSQQWIYDIDNDRVWIDEYGEGLNCWGDLTVPADTALVWSATADLWSTITGTWGSYEVASTKRLCHGAPTGIAYWHDDNFITRAGQQPAWSYQSIISDLGRALNLKTSQRFTMEHIHSANANSVAMRITDAKNRSLGQNKSLSEYGSVDDAILTYAHAQLSDEHLGISVSGQGPIRIRGYHLDWTEEGIQRRQAV